MFQALKTLRTAEFKPYIIFVRPRICDSQKKQLGSSSSLSLMITVSYMTTLDHVTLQNFSWGLSHRLTRCAEQEEDLQEMKHSAERMDECYGHWVDYVLVKEDPVSALAELQVVLERVHTEPQWVPVSWVRH